MAGRRNVTIVEYGITSSEDNLSEVDLQGSTSFVLSSSKLPSPRRGDIVEPNSPQEPDETLHFIDVACGEKTEFLCFFFFGGGRERPVKEAPRVMGAQAHASCKSYAEKDASSSEQQQEGCRQPTEKAPCLMGPVADSNCKSYALRVHQLLPDLGKLLAQCRSFFTREHSLEQAGVPRFPSPPSTETKRKSCVRHLYTFPGQSFISCYVRNLSTIASHHRVQPHEHRSSLERTQRKS